MRTDEQAPGWDSIDAAFGTVYGGDPVHVAPPPSQQPPFAGGVLNGISAYRREAHWHLVTFGLTDLFQGTSTGGASSGWGYELTLTTVADAGTPPDWAFALLMGIARTTVEHRERYAPGVRLGTGPVPTKASELVAVAFTLDRVVQPTQFPFGEYSFLHAVGITQAERDEMKDVGTETVLDRLAGVDPWLRTDPNRASA